MYFVNCVYQYHLKDQICHNPAYTNETVLIIIKKHNHSLAYDFFYKTAAVVDKQN